LDLPLLGNFQSLMLRQCLVQIQEMCPEIDDYHMKDWLDKCDKYEKLNFNAKLKIKEGLKGASKGYFPISLEKLRGENRALYDIVVSRGNRAL
jgi:hypothetical protein